MQITHKLAIVFLLIGALALPAAMPFANGQTGPQQSVPARVTITGPGTGTCGIDIPTGTTLNFGSLATQQQSSEQTLEISASSTQGVQQLITVRGTHWVATDGATPIMPVFVTHYSLSQGTPYSASTALTEQNAQFFLNAADTTSTSVLSYWVLRPFLDASVDPNGGPLDLTQIVTFTSSC